MSLMCVCRNGRDGRQEVGKEVKKLFISFSNLRKT